MHLNLFPISDPVGVNKTHMPGSCLVTNAMTVNANKQVHNLLWGKTQGGKLLSVVA